MDDRIIDIVSNGLVAAGSSFLHGKRLYTKER